MAIGTVSAFWAVSFLLVLVPGADWAYAIAAGLRDESVLPAVAGLLTGYGALTALVAAGVAALIARSPLVLAVLTTLGAVYLLWLGITTLTVPAAPVAAADQGSQPWARRAAKGAGISGLNPKALLLFMALLPQLHRRGHHGTAGTADTSCRRQSSEPVRGSRDDRHCPTASRAPAQLAAKPCKNSDVTSSASWPVEYRPSGRCHRTDSQTASRISR